MDEITDDQLHASDYQGEAHGAAATLLERHGRAGALAVLDQRIASCQQHDHADARNMLRMWQRIRELVDVPAQ